MRASELPAEPDGVRLAASAVDHAADPRLVAASRKGRGDDDDTSIRDTFNLLDLLLMARPYGVAMVVPDICSEVADN